MTVTAASLKARFPEFDTAPNGLVTGAIADAVLVVDTTYYGAKADSAVMYYAAHLIAINPLGEMARLQKTPNRITTYLTHYEHIKRSCGAGFRVI